MTFNFDLPTKTGVHRATAVVCVLLIFLTGFIAAVHFHADQNAPDHACSVCALAHAGVVAAELGPHIPIFVPSAVSEPTAATPGHLLLVSAHSIRPPPAV